MRAPRETASLYSIAPSRTSGSHLCTAILAFVAAMSAMVSCATPRTTSATASGAPRQLGLFSEQSSKREIEVAREMIEDGEYHQAIPRLQYTMLKYPGSAGSIEARYWLGMAYTRINDIHDALGMFNEYLEYGPDGERAAEVRAIAGELSERYRALYPTPEEIDRQIQAARGRLAANAGSPEATAELAELLWKRGNYDEAGALYAQLAVDHPETARAAKALERVELYADNTYVVLTPTEAARREAERNPLAIVNLSAFRAGRDTFTAVPRFYVVTGEAVNRGDSILYNVEVQATIYGFGNVVYDTNSAPLGRLYPGETRAFSIRFTNFEDINRIDRYEAVGRFQR